jgi:hypothetical protein
METNIAPGLRFSILDREETGRTRKSDGTNGCTVESTG